MCGGKKKEKKRMIRQMLNWNTDVVLAYNGRVYVYRSQSNEQSKKQ